MILKREKRRVMEILKWKKGREVKRNEKKNIRILKKKFIKRKKRREGYEDIERNVLKKRKKKGIIEKSKMERSIDVGVVKRENIGMIGKFDRRKRRINIVDMRLWLGMKKEKIEYEEKMLLNVIEGKGGRKIIKNYEENEKK